MTNQIWMITLDHAGTIPYIGVYRQRKERLNPGVRFYRLTVPRLFRLWDALATVARLEMPEYIQRDSWLRCILPSRIPPVVGLGGERAG